MNGFLHLGAAMKWEKYKDVSRHQVPRCATPIHGDLARLAPAYVETAEFDLLHDAIARRAQFLRTIFRT